MSPRWQINGEAQEMKAVTDTSARVTACLLRAFSSSLAATETWGGPCQLEPVRLLAHSGITEGKPTGTSLEKGSQGFWASTTAYSIFWHTVSVLGHEFAYYGKSSSDLRFKRIMNKMKHRKNKKKKTKKGDGRKLIIHSDRFSLFLYKRDNLLITFYCYLNNCIRLCDDRLNHQLSPIWCLFHYFKCCEVTHIQICSLLFFFR